MIKDELEVENNKEENIEEEIQNIDLSVFKKKKFSINGDPNKIIELDISDLNIITRIKEQYPKLEKIAESIDDFQKDGLSDAELISDASDKLKEADTKMREVIDTIFDSNVSEVCVPTGSMYDPINGRFRYDHLIDTLIKLYDENLTKELKKVKLNISKHTDKYTKRK